MPRHAILTYAAEPIEIEIRNYRHDGSHFWNRLLLALVRAAAGLRVLFITGYAETSVLGEGRLEPGMHVLTRPFAMEMLANRIRELIEAR